MAEQITAVLIDTSAYHNRQCDFSGITSEMIPMFLRLMENNHIPVLSHPILDNEVRNHIKDSQIIDRTKSLCKALRESKKILASVGVDSEELSDKITPEGMIHTLVKAYEEYQSKFVMLPYVQAEEIFADYFNTKPPFSATGAKKAEFPDAFVLKGLFRYCAENPDAKVLVISDDSDWEKTLIDHKQIILVATLQDAWSLLWPQLEDKTEFVCQVWSSILPEIMQEVAHVAESEAFEIDGIYSLEDIEVTSIQANTIIGDMVPLEITEDSALIHATVSLSVGGIADYLDESRSVWDREDQGYFYAAYTRMEFSNAAAEVECEVRLKFPTNGSIKPTEIQGIRLTNRWDISIDISKAETTEEDITDYGRDF